MTPEYEHWRYLTDSLIEFKTARMRVNRLAIPELNKLLTKSLMILQREQLKAWIKHKQREEHKS